MKARTANRAVRTYKKNKAKISSVSKSPLPSYHVLGLDGTLQEKVKSADNFNPLTPYSLSYNLCDDSLENMELDQPIIP